MSNPKLGFNIISLKKRDRYGLGSSKELFFLLSSLFLASFWGLGKVSGSVVDLLFLLSVSVH